MQAADVEPNRLVAARNAAAQFLDRVPERVRVGLVAFNQGAEVAQLPTTDRQLVARRARGDHAGAAAPRPATR